MHVTAIFQYIAKCKGIQIILEKRFFIMIDIAVRISVYYYNLNKHETVVNNTMKISGDMNYFCHHCNLRNITKTKTKSKVFGLHMYSVSCT